MAYERKKERKRERERERERERVGTDINVRDYREQRQTKKMTLEQCQRQTQIEKMTETYANTDFRA